MLGPLIASCSYYYCNYIVAVVIISSSINTSANEEQLFLTSRKCKWAAHTGLYHLDTLAVEHP